MAERRGHSYIKAMKSAKSLVFVSVLFLLANYAAAQAPYLFNMTFRGAVYQTNTTGQVVATPITETNLLLAAAQAGGTSDISQMALVYHIYGDVNHGDTIEVWNTSTRAQLTTLFGLYFADNYPDSTLGRSAITNSPGTQWRRVDYIYMFGNTALTYPNSHSMGASFTTKRFIGDASGNAHATINGDMEWIVNPYQGAGTRVCRGNFTTTKPF
jgi:hypothetical protein